MSQDVETLESELQEKDALVAALTERLEEAAEQLDRIHRSGGDRGLRMAGGIPVEVVEQQKALGEDLHRAIEQWEELQLGGALGRLEMQLSELRDLVAGNVLDGGGAASAATHAVSEAEPRVIQNSPNAPAEAEGMAGSAWEALKADLMAGEEPPPGEGGQQSESADTDKFTESLEDIDHVDPPPPIELDAAEPDELRQAVESRNDYIAYLLKRLRIVESQKAPSLDWESMENAPEELRERLQELEAKFDEKLRLAEVEHSLERARLGREEARLRLLEENARRQLKKMGVTLDGEDDETIEDDGEKSGRWLRMLGLKKEDE